MLSILKRPVATAAALAIGAAGLTAVPAPAQALDAQTQQTLGVILGLAALGYLVEENQRKNDNDKKSSKSSSNYYNDYWYGQNGDAQRYYDNRRYDDRHHGNNSRDNRKVIPQSCVVDAKIDRRTVYAVSERCYERARSADLPKSCRFDIRGGKDKTRERVYGLGCLADSGYRVSNRG